MTLDSIPILIGLRREQVCRAYNEEAFRYFLAVERARAERSHRFVYLALVAMRRGPGRRRVHLSGPIATALFRGLSTSVREVDFIGWYRESQVAAAVLAQGPKASDAGAAALIAERIAAELKKRLPVEESKHLRVRIVKLGGTTRA